MFERGALVLVPYPFTDLSARKRRPVLALTAPDSQGDFIGMPVTSRASQASGLALDSGWAPYPSRVGFEPMRGCSSRALHGLGRAARHHLPSGRLVD